MRRLDITVLPFTLRFGAESYIDRAGITSEQVLSRIATGSYPESLAPSVEEFSRAYRSLRDTCDGVLSIHSSSHLSDAVGNALIAREGFSPIGKGGPFPVAVADSLSTSMGLGWIVLAAARSAMEGLDLHRLSGIVTRMIGQTHVAFFTEQTEGLRRGGRAPRLATQWDSISSMKPLFHLDEGHILVYERTRTRPKARDALYNFVEDFPKIGELAVIHTGAHNDVEHLLTRVGAIYPRERVVVVQPGPAIASLLGPDALGVAVLEGEE